MLSEIEIETIKKEVEKAATAHLNASDADTALSHFSKDIYAVSNVDLFPSYDLLALEVKEYYESLKEVNSAKWEDIHVNVINNSAATFTARFTYQFTDLGDSVVKLSGIWTALFVLENRSWKIKLRHESFITVQ